MIFMTRRKAVSALLLSAAIGVVALPGQLHAQAAKFDAAAALVPEAVKTAGVLRIAMPDQGKPFAYKDGSDLKGMDVELAKAISATLGLEAQITLVPFDAALNGLKADKFDVSFGEFYIRPERLAVADFVSSWQTFDTFLYKSSAAVKPKAMTELCGLKAASMAASAELDKLQKLAKTCPADKPLEVSAFPAASGAVLALSSGRVDVVFTDRGVAEEAKKQDASFVSEGKFGEGLCAIAIQRNSKLDGLSKAFQAALAHLKESGEYQKILDANGIGYGALDEFKIFEANSTPPVYE